MSARILIDDLRSRNIVLALDGDELVAKAPPGVMTPEIQKRLAERKPDIIAELQNDRRATVPLQALEDRSGPFPLASSQERLWYLEQFDASAGANHVPFAYQLRGPIDLVGLQKAINDVVVRHSILRTRYTVVDDVVVQVIAAHHEIDIPITTLPDDRENASAAVRTVLRQQAAVAFDLENGPLIRFDIVKVSTLEHVLHVVAHHSVFDGWSIKIFMDEVAALYAAYVDGTPANLATRSLEYVDFAVWQRQRQAEGQYNDDIAFWKNYLAGAPPAFSLPTDLPRPPTRRGRGQTLAGQVPAMLASRLRVVGQAAGVTPFMTLLAAFFVLLHRYSRQNDIVVGSPVANRVDPNLEPLIGLFANTVVFRSRMNPDMSFRSLLNAVKESCLDALEHQDAPFEAVVDAVNPIRDLSRTPIFQVFFAFFDQADEPLAMSGLTTERISMGSEASQTDLSLWIERRGDGLELQLEFDSDLFMPSGMQRFLSHYVELLQAIVAAPDGRIDQLGFLSASERECLVDQWNRTQVDVPSVSSVHAMVQAQARTAPDRIALQDADRTLTYGDLDAQSTVLAHRLLAQGLREGDVVGVCLPRTPQLVISLLGVLKAGGTYLPLDPDFPAERLAYMVGDAEVSVLLTDGSPRVDFDTKAMSVLNVPDGSTSRLESADTDVVPARSANHAYVIYTSGSTGQPKGVCVPHRCVVNFLASMRSRPGITSDDVLLSVTTPSFDISVLELFLPLTVGARIHFADAKMVKDGTLLATEIDRSGATIMQATPATWRLLLDAGWTGKPDLKALCGGEHLALSLAQDLVPRVASVWNMYGPTETTIWSTCGRVAADDDVITVGTPIANTQVYVLEPTRQPAPIGVVGELYIGGAGVTDGYLGKRDLTADVFVEDTVSGRPGGRLYRTGDLARWRDNGALEIVGRVDRQVKVRGYRIEPAEIEAALSSHPAIRQCVVEPREVLGDDVRLVAYVVHETGEQITVSDARRFLRAKLPSYMVPSLMVTLSELPLTPNGKVDRDALPDPLKSIPTTQGFDPPQTPHEKMIAAIWAEVLGVSQVGRRDNFFELGGHSLLSMRVVHAVNRTSGYRIDPQSMYFQNLEQIARMIPAGRAFGT